MGATDGLAEDSRARWPRRRTAVLLTFVAIASVRVVASGGSIVVVVPSPADHIVVALHLALVAEAVVHRGGPIGRRCPSGLGTNRGLPILPMRCRGEVQGGSVPPGGGTLGLLHRGGLEEILELTTNPSPLRGRGLRHRAH